MTDAYNWYNSKPQTVEATPDKKDQRKLSGYGIERELSTGCKCEGDWTQCKYGKKSSYDKHCMYLKFNIMCDKLIVNGDEIN